MIQLFKSNLKNKRYMVVFENGSTVHFGSPEYENFTMHRDSDRKRLYIIRHQTREDWNDIKTPGFWSRWLIWNLPTLSQSIRDTEKRFGIKIVNKTSS
jgi:hypothetical protein